jgi:hypothetical protein
MNSPQQARQLAEIDTMIERVDKLREERERRVEIDEMTRKLRARRLAASGAPAVSGEGWHVAPGPTSHQDIEQYVRDVHAVAFHNLKWPDQWRVFWADTRDAFAVTSYKHRLILIDRSRVADRNPDKFLRTVCHEVAHMLHPVGTAHGAAFQKTLESAFQYVRSIPTIVERAQRFVRSGGERPPQSPASLAPGGSRSKTPKEIVMTNYARREYLAPGEIDAAQTALRLKRFHADLLRRRPDAASYDISYKPRVDAMGQWHATPIVTKARDKK